MGLRKNIAQWNVKENGRKFIEKHIYLLVSIATITVTPRTGFGGKKILEFKKVNHLPKWLKKLLLSYNEE